MTTPPRPEEFFGGGAPSVSLDPGQRIEGEIVAQSVSQQTAYNPAGGPGEALYWDEEKTRPKWQLVVTVQTDLRDPKVAEDDGRRRVFIKGERLEKAVKDALEKAGARATRVGGRLGVACTGYDPESRNKVNPAKLYVARYTAPAPVGDSEAGDYFDQAASQAPPPPEPPRDPWEGQAAAPAPQAASAPAGVDGATGEIVEPWRSETSPIPAVPDEQWRGYNEDVRRAMWNMHSGGVTTGAA